MTISSGLRDAWALHERGIPLNREPERPPEPSRGLPRVAVREKGVRSRHEVSAGLGSTLASSTAEGNGGRAEDRSKPAEREWSTKRSRWITTVDHSRGASPGAAASASHAGGLVYSSETEPLVTALGDPKVKGDDPRVVQVSSLDSPTALIHCWKPLHSLTPLRS